MRLSEITSEIKSAPPGRLAGRFFKVLLQAQGKAATAAELVERNTGWAERVQIANVCKAAVSAPSNEASIFAPVAQDMAGLVGKISAMRRLQGFRTVPNNTNCIPQTIGATAYWGADGLPVPVSTLAFSRSALAALRINALSVVPDELAQAAGSELNIAADHARAISEKVDDTFFNPENQGSPEVLPKSITADAPIFVSTGSSVSSVDSDLRLLIQSLVTGGSNLVNAVWVMNPITAAYLGSLRGSGGSPSYPEIGALGGRLLGLPAIATAGITRVGSPTPGTSYICLVDASRVWLTEVGATFRASNKAVIEMSDTPTNKSTATATGASLVSMFQTDSTALLSDNYMNWRAVDAASAAASLTGVTY